MLALALTVTWAAKAQPRETAANKAGEALYNQRCAALKQMSPENVRAALLGGSMAVEGLGLSTAPIADLAEFLTGKRPVKEQIPAAAFCAADARRAFADPFSKPHWNGWASTWNSTVFNPVLWRNSPQSKCRN